MTMKTVKCTLQYKGTKEKKSKKIISCGRKTIFDYDDSGIIIYTPMDVEDTVTSGDESDDSDGSNSDDDNDLIEKLKKIERDKDSKEKNMNDNKNVVKHNREAKALLTGASGAGIVEAEGLKPQGGGSRKGL